LLVVIITCASGQWLILLLFKNAGKKSCCFQGVLLPISIFSSGAARLGVLNASSKQNLLEVPHAALHSPSKMKLF